MELRDLAKLRFDLDRTIIDGPDGRGMRQLLRLIGASDADSNATVLLYSLDHIPDTWLDDLTRYANVETQSPRRRWAKRVSEDFPAGGLAVRARREVSEETRSIPAVAGLREALEVAQRRFRDEVNR